MGTDLEKARRLLEQEGYTCVLCRAERTYVSNQRGVQPLMELLEQGAEVAGFSAADKIVGRATALLYALLGVRELYAPVISRPALEVLKARGIRAEYDTLIDGVVNRTGDGPCPMEAATAQVTEPALAPEIIRGVQQRLRQQANT